MIDRRLLSNFDWGILSVALLLSFIGVMTIYSATRTVVDVEQPAFYSRQLYWIGIGLITFLLSVSIDYKWLIRYAYLIFALGVIILIVVLVLGKKGMGAQRWISFGSISFQPSEFFRICFVFAVSRYLSAMEETLLLGFRELVKMAFTFFLVPSILILKQPHLGTVIILFLIFLSLVLTAGTRKRIIILALILSLISLPFVGNILWSELKAYQRQRIIAFIDPYVDPHGIGYHIKQSKVSIGSGGFWGKGYLKGTQGPLRFLPERHTDFIFSVFAEEWGFAGSLFLFFLYGYVILRGFDTARKARDPAGGLLAVGVTSSLFFYCAMNIGMTLGIVPVVGVPLPFMSYGGTALVSNFLSIGILANVRMRSFALFY